MITERVRTPEKQLENQEKRMSYETNHPYSAENI